MSDTKQDVTDEMSDQDEEHLASADNNNDENVIASENGDNSGSDNSGSHKNATEVEGQHDPEKVLLLL